MDFHEALLSVSAGILVGIAGLDAVRGLAPSVRSPAVPRAESILTTLTIPHAVGTLVPSLTTASQV